MQSNRRDRRRLLTVEVCACREEQAVGAIAIDVNEEHLSTNLLEGSVTCDEDVGIGGVE